MALRFSSSRLFGPVGRGHPVVPVRLAGLVLRVVPVLRVGPARRLAVVLAVASEAALAVDSAGAALVVEGSMAAVARAAAVEPAGIEERS